jgi:hypothetical protein
LNNIRIIKTVRDAKEALCELAEHRFQQQLTIIRQTAQSMAQARAGTSGRDQAVRAVLIGFADNVDALELAS